MNILYHHRTLGDGAEGIHVASIVNAFRDLGHDVKLAALVGDKTGYSASRARPFEILRRYAPEVLYETMEIGYTVPGYWLLTGKVRGWKPRFLYERYTLFNLAGLLAARRLKIPLVLEVNSPLAFERVQYERLTLKRTARFLERFLFRRADLILAVSSPLREYIVRQGVSEGKVVVLPNGTDPAVFRPNPDARNEIRLQFGIPAEAIVVGFVGILRPWHGVDLLINAFAKLRDIPQSVFLLIVGDGPSQSELEQLAHSLGLSRQVFFTGRVAHQEVAKSVAAFDIAVSPRATFYASPMKVLEYMSTGIAVVAPRMSNLEDLISDKVDGVLFRPEDIDDLAMSMQTLIQDTDFRTRLAKSARAKVENDRTWLQNARQTLNLVEGLPTWQ